MEEMDITKYMNGSIHTDYVASDITEAIRIKPDAYKNLIEAVRKYYPSSLSDHDLLFFYYTNECLIQNQIRLEFKKVVMRHIDKIVDKFVAKEKLNPRGLLNHFSVVEIRREILRNLDQSFSYHGLFYDEDCNFFLTENWDEFANKDYLEYVSQILLELHHDKLAEEAERKKNYKKTKKN